MYDIRQFRPTLFILLIVGFVGYALAAETPGLLVLALAGTITNWQLDRQGKFRPLHRLMANIITLGAGAWLFLRIRTLPGQQILAIGEFLVLLQMVKLYERRGNRDLAQLLVLNLLLMVAAAISTASLAFGLILIAYLFLSLYCCLLFHLKVETDHAKAAMFVDESKLNPMTLRQDQRFLGVSMRRLTGFASLVAVGMAVFVFLFFPRGAGAGIIGNLNFKPSQAITGFSDEMSFQDVARISQNQAEVAYVEIDSNGKPWGKQGDMIYLRGSCLDQYISDPRDADRWKWMRTTQAPADVTDMTAGSSHVFMDSDADVFHQKIRLLPNGRNFIFAMPGITTFSPSKQVRVQYGLRDAVLQLTEPVTSEFRYEVLSTSKVEVNPRQTVTMPMAEVMDRMTLGPRPNESAIPPQVIPPEIREIALRDDVSGVDGNGSLAQQRLKLNSVSNIDSLIAGNIVSYFKKNFTYTLDLTDAGRDMNKDPLVQFLTDFKRGHCEYFAGAMTLMCQSLGMQSRVVIGFKCDEFNAVGGYFIVKQSHAHAWVEVLTPKGWEIFDPTSSRNAGGDSNSQSWSTQIKHFFNYLEYAWGNNVVNYDSDSRTNIINSLDSTMMNSTVKSSQFMMDLRESFSRTRFYSVFSNLLSGFMSLLAGIAVLAVVWFLFERLRIRRLARRIGLDALSTSDQMRLAKQLGFYDEMLSLLERNNVYRQKHLTPMEFSRSIGFLPGDVFSTVQRLTRVFYRVRYGGAVVQVSQQRRLARVVERLAQTLNQKRA